MQEIRESISVLINHYEHGKEDHLKFSRGMPPIRYQEITFFLFTLFILGIKIQFNAPLEIIKY